MSLAVTENKDSSETFQSSPAAIRDAVERAYSEKEL